MALRQFERARRGSGVMRVRAASVALLAAIMVSQLFLDMAHEVLEDSAERRETDYGGPITYTDEHTYATVGTSDRSATLVMPGGHDYDRPLPLVVSLHGYTGWGTQNSAYMGLYDSVHQNEHLLLSPDGSMNWFVQRWWNATDACCNNFDEEVDDVGYLDSLIEEAILNYGADPDGVVIMGLSNGGFMSHRMACDSGDTIRSIVSLNGATWDDFASNCPDTGRPDILHVHSTADGVIQYNGGSILGSQYPSALESVGYWAARSGCDSSMTLLGSLDLINSDGVRETDSYENLNCSDGNRVAHWKVNNGSHVPSLNDPEWAGLTLSWALSGFVRDSDGDGYRDDIDAFIYNSNEWSDLDGDMIGDNADQCDQDPSGWDDSDGDGICLPNDLFPEDPDEWSDADGDGIGDNADLDDDNDGVNDDVDAFPLDSSEWYDTDADGIGNNADIDDDGDGWQDSEDAFPLDATEYADFDEDGVGDNADLDDDNDGWSDLEEMECDTNPNDSSQLPLDSDGDGICNLIDIDDDGDGTIDDEDVFPLNPEEWSDSDEDGVGDNSDVFPTDDSEWLDSDEDGVGDNSDVFPTDDSEWLDSDGDGVGDNSDEFPEDGSEWIDSDGDGVGDNADAFPNDPRETTDTDYDGVGDVSDVFPNDPSEWMDTDADGFGDNSDVFSNDSSEWLDSDGDGIGDNADYYPLDPEKWEKDPPYLLIGVILFVSLSLVLSHNRRRNT